MLFGICIAQPMNPLVKGPKNEKPVCVLLASSDPRMRAGHRMQMSVLKLRNRGYSSDPFILPASFEYSRVGGDQVRRAQETEAEKFTPEDFMDEDIFDDE